VKLYCGVVLVVLAVASAVSADGPKVLFAAADWPPYFVGESGFAREVLERCLPAAGLEPKFSPLPVERVFVALQEGRVDGHVMPRSSDRERYVAFGEVPIFRDGYRLVARADAAIRFDSLPDLGRLRLGHREGLRYTPEYLAYVRSRRGVNVVLADSTENLLDLLLERRIDVFVALEGTVRALVARRDQQDRIQVLPRAVSDGAYYLALARRSPRIANPSAALARFDECLTQMKRDGTYVDLAAAWHVPTD
jgi:polar amino acid transport system substrate-binding protein